MISERLWGILVDSFGKLLMPGLLVTLPITAISFVLAMVIAIGVALVQFAGLPGLKPLARLYIWFIRGTPLLVQLFVVYFGLGHIGLLLSPFTAAVVTLSVNSGAYCAETVRAALESVPPGQIEAGECVGMTWFQTVWHIVLPQAMRTAFPSLSNSLISMLKDTSLLTTITVAEMFMASRQIVSRVYEPLAIYLEVALIYLMFSTLLTKLQSMGEKRLNVYQYR